MADHTAPQSRRFQCRHIHAAGHRCGSPCLRGEHFCYYHHTSRRPTQFLGQVPDEAVFNMPSLEDRASIQLALADILARVAANSLDSKRAGLLLYGIKLASYNLRRMDAARPSTRAPEPHPSEVAAVIEDLELDPELGPLAPVAEVGEPDAAEKSLRQRFMDFMNSPDRVCDRCVERDRLDANREAAARMVLEREREDPNDLEIRRLADRVRATLPNIQAVAIAESNAIAAARAASKAAESRPKFDDPAGIEPVPESGNDPETWAKFAAHLH
jgi:hypothetical protein